MEVNMAKLARLFKKIEELKRQLNACSNAYLDILEKYNKLYQKYSYEETMERVKEIEKIRKIEGKIVWENLKEKNTIKEN